MTPKQQCIEEMILVGSQMANLCSNFSQTPERAADKHNRETMDSLVRQWDSSLREYRKLTKKKQ